MPIFQLRADEVNKMQYSSNITSKIWIWRFTPDINVKISISFEKKYLWVYIETRRERPKSALYLRLKIKKGETLWAF